MSDLLVHDEVSNDARTPLTSFIHEDDQVLGALVDDVEVLDSNSEASPSPNGCCRGTRACTREPGIAYLIPCVVLMTCSAILLLPVLPEVKKVWYSNCKDVPANTSCIYSQDDVQFYGGLYDSMRGVLCFLVSAFLGRLSDAVGRKPIILFSTLLTMLPTVALYLSNSESASVYYTFSIMSGLSGSAMGGATGSSPLIAYISDVYPQQARLRYYGYLAAVGSVSICLMPVLSGRLATTMSHQSLYLLSIGLSVLNAVYILLILPESLDKDKRNELSKHTVDPFAPLRLLRRSTVLRWLSVVLFMNYLPETGLVEIALQYCDTELGLDKDAAARFNGEILTVFGISQTFSQTVLLYGVQRLGFRYTTILVLSQIANILHMLAYALVMYIPRREVVYSAGLMSSVVFLSGPASSSIVSEYMGSQEQGFALGTLASVRGLTATIGPLMFGTMLSFFDRHFHLVNFPFLFGSVVIVFGIYFTLTKLDAILRRPRLVHLSHSMMFSPRHQKDYSRLNIRAIMEETDEQLEAGQEADEDVEGTNP